jgi:hypothetical protein
LHTGIISAKTQANITWRLWQIGVIVGIGGSAKPANADHNKHANNHFYCAKCHFAVHIFGVALLSTCLGILYWHSICMGCAA